MSEINPIEGLSPEEVKRVLEAFHSDPSLQRMREHFKKASPPWPKVRDMPQTGP